MSDNRTIWDLAAVNINPFVGMVVFVGNAFYAEG
jgi:hypothetical protein